MLDVSRSAARFDSIPECVEIRQRDGVRLKERCWVWTWRFGDKERPEKGR